MSIPSFSENSFAWKNFEKEIFTTWKEVFDVVELDRYIKGTSDELSKIDYQIVFVLELALKKYFNLCKMQFLNLKIKSLKQEINYETNYVNKVETSLEQELRKLLSLVLGKYIKDCEIILKGLKSKENLNLKEYILDSFK
jgi:hypothetical protein